MIDKCFNFFWNMFNSKTKYYYYYARTKQPNEFQYQSTYQKFEPYDNLKKYKLKDNPNKFILLRL